MDSFFYDLKTYEFKIFEEHNLFFRADGDGIKQEVVPFSKFQIVVDPIDFFTLSA
jgi:hypothetical protein